MVENKSSLFGIIALIIGASGLGLGAFSIVNFQTVEGPQGIPGDDGQDGIDGIDGEDAPGGIIVGILDPDEGEIISGDVTIRAMIAGSEDYTISILRNGTEIGTALPMTWNTTLVADGWWNITVIVMDVLTYNRSSDQVLVYVDNNLTMARVYRDSNISVSGSSQPLDYNAKSYDPENCFNLTNDRYNIPKDGYYLIITQIRVLLLDGENIILEITNSTGDDIGYSIESFSGSSGYATVSFSDIQYFQRGDYLYVRFAHSGSTDRNLMGGSDATFFSIMCVS